MKIGDIVYYIHDNQIKINKINGVVMVNSTYYYQVSNKLCINSANAFKSIDELCVYWKQQIFKDCPF